MSAVNDVVGQSDAVRSERNQDSGVSTVETLVNPSVGANTREAEMGDDMRKETEIIGNNGGVVMESNSNVQIADGNGENETFSERNDEEECVTEIEGHFNVSDLVWGKVRSHPWWPGQIFDPADSSEKARKYCKKDRFLIAYFGDQTFAWNEASSIKPFREKFSQMEKQSKSESFSHAVDRALEEVSRRLEFGLACSCLSEEVYSKIKTQSTVNAGIREQSSRRDGSDEHSNVASFLPGNLVQYLKDLAQSPRWGTDRLKFVTARAQLLAFNRHQGFFALPEFEMLNGSLEDGVEHIIPLGDEEVPLEKEKVGIKDSSSKKRKKISSDKATPIKKERNMSDLLCNSHSSSLNDKSEQELTSVKKRKASDLVKKKKTSLSPVTQKQISSVGESIRRVVPILKDGRNRGPFIGSPGKPPGRENIIHADYPSPDEMLSHLYSAARDPMKGYNNLHSSNSFLSDMRNFFSLENFTSREKGWSIGKSSGKQSGEKLSEMGTMETSGVEGMEDSYWTDRVVESNTQEQVLFEPETPNERGAPSVESGPKLDGNEETTDRTNEKCGEEYNPTALILNFTDIESVPSQSNLNNVFRRYGPLNELGTEVLKKSKRAKVIFKRRCDAETAFSSSGKFSIFGPSLVSYRLHYLPSRQSQSSPAKKRSKKGADPVDGNDA